MKQSMDIEVLFVSHKSPPATGGMEKQSYELINGVALYLKVHTLVYDHRESILLFFIRLNRRILKLLKSHPNIRVIHFNDGLLASIATFHTGYNQIKKTATIHGLDIVYPLSYFQNKIIPRFNKFDRVFAVSNATAQAALHRGIKAEKLQVIPNGVDSSPSTASSNLAAIQQKYPEIQKDKKLFVTLGRPVKRKGFSWLLENVIPQIQQDFQLVMLGPYRSKKNSKDTLLNVLPSKLRTLTMLFLGYPSDQDRLRRILPQQAPRAIHLGKVPFEDLQTLLKESTAFLMPNIAIKGDMEGFGLVCLEASIAGTLVVASSLEGITSAVHDKKNGILLPAQDDKAWITTLQDILDRPQIYHKLAEAYTDYTRSNYSWDIMARAYCEAFTDISD